MTGLIEGLLLRVGTRPELVRRGTRDELFRLALWEPEASRHELLRRLPEPLWTTSVICT